jgi:chromate transporter
MTTTTKDADFERNWKNVASSLLKVGFTWGGPMWAVMQAELQEKQQWVSKERFVEGLSLVNMLPGAPGPQLAIVLGYARGGILGGLLAGLCLVLPGFFILLTMAYNTLGATPLGRGALHGVGPIVLSILAVAVYRLGKSTVCTITQCMIAIVAVAALIWSSLGIAAILLLAGGVGLLVFYSKKIGVAVLALLTASITIVRFSSWFALAPVTAVPQVASLSPSLADIPSVADIGVFFLQGGALTFGGAYSMIAFIHEQVVNQFHWLTPQEFIDGLALGQLTPGPILMVAAYVGYKVAGVVGAVFATAAIFLPAFMMMLAMLPVLDRVRTLVWTKAAMQGIGPALIGVIAVALVQMAPHALPDPFAIAIFIATVIALLKWRIDAVKLIIAGLILGVLWSLLFSFPVKQTLFMSLRARV